MLFIDKMPPEQFTLLATVIGIILASDLDLSEQNSIGNFLVSVGQTMLTAAAQGELQKSQQAAQQQNQYICQQIENLNLQINMLRKKVSE